MAAIYDRYEKRKASGTYSDLHNGKVYQDHIASGFLSNRHNVSFTLNTDGVPVFKFSGFSFWPIYLSINELPYKMRFVIVVS